MFYINYNGDFLLDDSFSTRNEAQSFIDESVDEDDGYLLNIIELTEAEFETIRCIAYLSIEDSEKALLHNAINDSINKDFVVKQLFNHVRAGFFEDEYFKHFQCAVIHGGYISGEEDWTPVELISYSDFLRKKVEQMESFIEAQK